MGKIITAIVVIFILLVMSGTCEDCGCGVSCGDGCDGCDGCGSCESCEDCSESKRDERYYFDSHYGEITLKIHKADGTTVELSGTRDSSDPNSIFYYRDYKYRIRGLSYADDLGYFYSLSIKMDSTIYRFYDEDNGVSTIFGNRLMYYHKDGSTIDLYETRSEITYSVNYMIELNGVREQVYCNYTIGKTILKDEIQNAIDRVFSGSRYDFNGFVIDGTKKLFDTEGEVDRDFILQFGTKTSITVKAVAQGQKVNVKLHYNLSGVEDEVRQVPFNIALDSLWDLPIDKLEFLGWSISPTEFIKWTGEIPEKYVTETLNLYAVHKFYKEITIDGQAAKVYEDNTLSINIPNNAMGLKENVSATQYFKFSKLYDVVQEGKNYYWHIAG